MVTLEESQRQWWSMAPEERAEAGPGVIDVCAEALGSLRDRLHRLDYPAPITTPCPAVASSINELEVAGLAVPPPLRRLWELVGDVCFIDRDHYAHVSFWIDHGVPFRTSATRDEALPQFSDGVDIAAPCSPHWLDFQIDELRHQAEIDEPLAFVIAPDGYHKDDISGGMPYELLPSDEDPWAPTLRWFEWAGVERPRLAQPVGTPLDLITYLRIALLECGGFPGLYGSDGYEPTRRALTAGLPVF